MKVETESILMEQTMALPWSGAPVFNAAGSDVFERIVKTRASVAVTEFGYEHFDPTSLSLLPFGEY